MRIRPRRNRKSQAVREMVQDIRLHPSDFIYPLFLLEKDGAKEEISSMPGRFRLGPDLLKKEIAASMEAGIRCVCLFPVIDEGKKDKTASYSWDERNHYLKTISSLKKEFPELMIMTDVAMDPYSSDGHDGLVENGEILNDETLEILGKMSLAQAQAGADILGPSDMMDGRVAYIRDVLEKEGHSKVSIISYCAKYASSFYGPFRDALGSAPKSGDKKTYQLNPANYREAALEIELDMDEGADILMVKPALAYLDIIKMMREMSSLPVAAYQVSGEYAMIKAASEKGWLDEEAVMLESLVSIKRAGADLILSYFSRDAAEILKNN